MLKQLSGRWAHVRLGAELVNTIRKKLGKLTLRFNWDLITEVRAWEYPRGTGGTKLCGHYYPINEKERGFEANALNKDTQFGVCLGSWNRGLRAQSSCIRPPKDQMSDLESYPFSCISAGDI